MKSMAVNTVAVGTSGLTLRKLLRKAARSGTVFLTDKGKTKYALVPADDFDQEISALRANTEFMAFLSQREEAARRGPCKTMQEVREEFGLPRRPAPRKA
jgi:hypothetical protein